MKAVQIGGISLFIDIRKKLLNLRSIYPGLNQSESFRIYRDLWEKTGDYQILTDFPLHLDIELSGICNLKCKSCFQNNLILNPLGFMDVNMFQNIIDDSAPKGLSAIKLQIRGESFLHPNLFECIRYAKEAGIMDVQITTNGTLLNTDHIHMILNSGLDAIIFSIDTHHNESYNVAFKDNSYSSVEAAIKNFLKLRSKMGKSRPWVRLRASVDHHIDKDTLTRIKKDINERFPEADIIIVGGIHNFRYDVDSFPDLHSHYKMTPCSYIMQRLAIFWNGDVTTCCMDYNNHFQLGNVRNQSIQDIWLSEKMNLFREKHFNQQRKSMPICRHCNVCILSVSDDQVVDSTLRHIADYT